MNNGWRTIIIKPYESLLLRDNSLVMKNENDEHSVPIEQIGLLLVSSNKGAISLPLLTRLAESNVKVLFCDNKYMPVCELNSVNIHFESAGRLMDQAKWTDRKKHTVWKHIVELKIACQINLLKLLKLDVPEILKMSVREIKSDDATNREALAAKAYFNRLFGESFIRHASDDINATLNYGYTILCSYVARTISTYGYNTALGIHHCNRQNSYNLACDLMEPFRPFIDYIVYQNQSKTFDFDYQQILLQMFYGKCIYDGKKMSISSAIDMFVMDTLKSMEMPRKKLKVISFE